MALFKKKKPSAAKDRAKKADKAVLELDPGAAAPENQTGGNPITGNPAKDLLIRKALAKVGNPLPEGAVAFSAKDTRPSSSSGPVDLEDMAATSSVRPKPKMDRGAVLREAFGIMNDPQVRQSRAKPQEEPQEKPREKPRASGAAGKPAITEKEEKVEKIAALLKSLKQPPPSDEAPPDENWSDKIPVEGASDASPARDELLAEAMRVRASKQNLMTDIDEEARERLSRAVFKKMNLTLGGDDD